MSDQELAQVAAVLFGLGATVALEHILLGKLWKRYELARRVMGIATVLGWLFFAVLMGALDLATWLVALFAFGTAGAIVGLCVICEKASITRRAEGDLEGGWESDGTEGRSGTQLPG